MYVDHVSSILKDLAVSYTVAFYRNNVITTSTTNGFL
jgi:hypothetical protein